MHHIAFSISQATFAQTVERLDERGIKHSGPKDRGFMDSIYFTDPLGTLIELASYRFDPPAGFTHTDVLFEAHLIRTERGDPTSTASIWPTLSSSWCCGRNARCPRTERPRLRMADLEQTLDDLLGQERFEPPAAFAKGALDRERSQPEDWEAHWVEQAKELAWFKEPTQGLNDSDAPFFKWFEDGTINAVVQLRRPPRRGG